MAEGEGTQAIFQTIFCAVFDSGHLGTSQGCQLAIFIRLEYWHIGNDPKKKILENPLKYCLLYPGMPMRSFVYAFFCLF
jgi:hypothetical protein